MPAKSSRTKAAGFSAEERAAMKERAEELRAEGKGGAKKADELQAVLDSIAKMAPEDRVLAECVHQTVTATAPELSPKTWYGMPAYANADGKVVVFFQDSGKFNYRAGVVRAPEVERHGREEGRRAGEGCALLKVAPARSVGLRNRLSLIGMSARMRQERMIDLGPIGQALATFMVRSTATRSRVRGPAAPIWIAGLRRCLHERSRWCRSS
jgi:uncharacterized protein YdhG (YjbR/CyaY superfamily)